MDRAGADTANPRPPPVNGGQVRGRGTGQAPETFRCCRIRVQVFSEFAKNTPPLVTGFAVQRAEGAELALRLPQLVAMEGDMPDGGRNSVQIAVASIPALLAMKGYAIANRLKLKDAYDIYFSIRNFPGCVEELVAATEPLLQVKAARQGYLHIAEKFRRMDDFGPTCVRKFVDRADMLEERSADQWQQDAFGQVNAWLSELGLT